MAPRQIRNCVPGNGTVFRVSSTNGGMYSVLHRALWPELKA